MSCLNYLYLLPLLHSFIYSFSTFAVRPFFPNPHYSHSAFLS